MTIITATVAMKAIPATTKPKIAPILISSVARDRKALGQSNLAF